MRSKGRSGTLLCSYLLSLDVLPPIPQLDRSYPSKDRARRADVEKANSAVSPSNRKNSVLRDGWIVVGHGQEVVAVEVENEERVEQGTLAVPRRTDWTEVNESSHSSHLSTSSSVTTISQSSFAASATIQVSTCSPYDPIDIGDDKQADSKGQQDRRDGRLDQVFALHSSRRMKPTSTGRGVSIPSREW